MKNNRDTNRVVLGPDSSEDASLGQFNVRVPKRMKRTIKTAIQLAGLDVEMVAQDAWKAYFGVQDELARSRQAMVNQAFKNVTRGQKRPFDEPLIPINNNATLTHEGDSAKLTIRMGS